MNYDDFLHSKVQVAQACGFEMPKEQMNPMMFEWQKDITRWALRSRNNRMLFIIERLRRNQKAERKMLMQKPWENSSGLPDPTAYAATKTISEEEQRVSDLVKALRYIISLSDFELINRMEFRNRRSGRVYR